MNRNPYAPPRAEIRGNAAHLLVRPKPVTTAIYLFWVSVPMGVIAKPNLISFWRQPGATLLVASLVIGIFTALIVGLWVKIASGRRWARTVLATVMLVGFVPGIKTLLSAWAGSKVAGFFTSAQFALQAASVILLFVPRANDWFSRSAISTSESAAAGGEGRSG